jgi:hypothetical protein
VFLEQNIDATIGARYNRWWAAYGSGGSVYLPLVMTDSGHQFTYAASSYNSFKALVDVELGRAPGADLAAFASRVDNHFRVIVQVVNRSGTTLSSSNAAAVHIIVYEDIKVGVTSRTVRDAVFATVSPAIADGGAGVFTLDTQNISPADWTKVHVIALVDYRPGGATGAWDMLQAAIATASGPGPTFTDDPLAAGNTAVKAVHLTELRQAIDQLRARYGFAGYAWTDTTVTPGSTPVKAVHLTEMRSALNDVYNSAARTPPTYTTPTLTAGAAVISSVHIAELRAAVLAIW